MCWYQKKHANPNWEAQRDHVPSTPEVRHASEGNHRKRVGEREGAPGQQAHLRVGQCELALHRLDEHRQHLPVHHVERGEPEAQREHVVGVASRRCGHRMFFAHPLGLV